MASRKDNDRKEDTTTATTSTSSSTADTKSSPPSQRQQRYREQEQEEQQQHHAINKALQETKDNIRKTTDEARSQIPRYTQAVNDYQEQTIQAAREIADNYLDSQREIINSFQSVWSPYAENTFRTATNNWIVSPRSIAELYANMVSSIANNMIAVTRLTNNMIFANMQAFKTSIQQAKDNAKELSRIGVNAAKTFEQQTSSRGSARQIGTTTTRVSVENEEEEEDKDKDRLRKF
jgi:hypothetical protein